MMKNLGSCFTGILIGVVLNITLQNMAAQTPEKSETVSLNGTTIYYEVFGKGEPLFLLHGFTQSSKSWYPFVVDYINEYKVYLVDLKGHGKSGMFSGKLSISDAARDVDALIQYLGIDSIKAIGFSYGGDVLFQLCLIHPGLLKSMIIIGACGSWFAPDYPEWVEYLSYNNIKNLPWMQEQQTSEEQIKSILEQVINYDVKVTDVQLKSIATKTLIVVGDGEDSIGFDCILAAKNNMPECYLWVVPNTGHSAHKNENKDDFVKMARKFFAEAK